MPERRVIGLDLSLTCTGIASSAGWCTTVGRDGVTKMPIDQRLHTVDEIHAEIGDFLYTDFIPDLVVIEQPAYSRSGAGSLERHALWWMVVRSLRHTGIPVATVSPGTLKKYATSKGTATKTAVVDAVARRWPAFETRGNDNAADAVVLAAMGCDHLGTPLATMPATHRAALAAVTWPQLPAGTSAPRRDAPPISELIERSSLGTPAARALRARTPIATAQAIVARAHQQPLPVDGPDR